MSLEVPDASYFLVGDKERPSNHYRVVAEEVQFSKDGQHWRSLTRQDLELHLELRTPLAPWLRSRLGNRLTASAPKLSALHKRVRNRAA